MESKSVRARLLALTALAALATLGPVAGARAASVEDLRKRVSVMEQQLKDLKKQLSKTERKAEEAKAEATSEETRTINWHLGGYGTADYTATDAAGESNSFVGGQFNPIFLVGYQDLLLFESELEVATTSDGETTTKLEFGNLNLSPTDWLTITAGKFLSPLGDFQQHSHPSWINKLPDRPAGFVEDGGTEHLSEVGVMLRGAVPVDSTTVDYAVFVGNGPRLADSADGGVKLEGFGNDSNESKAYGGRIGFRPLPYVNLGLSGMTTTIKGNAGSGGMVTSGDYDMEVADAAYTRGNWDVRGEYIRAHLAGLISALSTTTAPVMIPASTWHAWYAQAAYRLAGITDNRILRNVEPVVRYSQYHVSGLGDFQANEEDRWTFGLDYWFAPSIVAKAAYESKDFRRKTDEELFHAQLSFGF